MDITQRNLSLIEEQAAEPFLTQQPSGTNATSVSELLEKETRCGLGPFKPAWLQKLASKKTYVIVYGLIGTIEIALSSYYVATVSTMEKRFKIPSKVSGLIISAWDMGAIFAFIIIPYLGRSGHQTRWVAWSTVVVALSCFLRISPHLIYGPGDDALSLTEEFGSAGTFQQSGNFSTQEPVMSLCGNNYTEYEDCENSSSGYISAAIMFTAHALIGVGVSAYNSLGISYMDDNSLKNKVPMLLASSQCIRMLGPTLGYLLASYALELYVDPALTPTVNSKDPKWIGAWWFGWVPFGIANLILALLMALFPRSLPRAAQRNAEAAAAKGEAYNPQAKPTRSFSDYKITMKRLLSNKLLMCNCMSSVFFIFGLEGQWVFLPKYMETQFRQTASNASLITGSVGLLCTAAGVMVSAGVISRFKPGPRYLAAWNVIVEWFDVLGYIALSFLGCQALDIFGTHQKDGMLNLNMDCNANCSCPLSLQYTPVCDTQTQTTFFSACHAGCQEADWLNMNSSTKSFSSCLCASAGSTVIDGSCAVDCTQAFIFFILIQCIQRFLSATGRAGNILIQFRCVSQEDKAVAIGFVEFVLCAFAFIPGPIVFGIFIDMACIVWGFTCGETGNCVLYDVDKLRKYVNIPVVGMLLIGTLFDMGTWYYAKGLEMYDTEDDDKKEKNDDTGGQ